MAEAMRAVAVALAALLCIRAAAAEEGSALLREAHVDLGNRASLQRGAKYYVNYCLGCHSARYVRYSRVGQDLGIDPHQLTATLMFTADKPQQTMEIAMPAADAKRWFGRSPPDLSLVARSRGPDWIYNYLTTFYLDDSTPWGVNNLVLPNAAMPHVLWELQGTQRAVFREEKDSAGHSHSIFERFEPVSKGSLTPEQYDAAVRDIV